MVADLRSATEFTASLCGRDTLLESASYMLVRDCCIRLCTQCPQWGNNISPVSSHMTIVAVSGRGLLVFQTSVNLISKNRNTEETKWSSMETSSSSSSIRMFCRHISGDDVRTLLLTILKNGRRALPLLIPRLTMTTLAFLLKADCQSTLEGDGLQY